MSAPWPDPAHVCAGSGEPILDAWTHGCIRMLPGATADEITEEVIRISGSGSSYEHRMMGIRVREIVASTGWGASKTPSADDVLATHRRLEAAKEDAGERSIAKVYGVHESTIHRVRLKNGLIPWPKD